MSIPHIKSQDDTLAALWSVQARLRTRIKRVERIELSVDEYWQSISLLLGRLVKVSLARPELSALTASAIKDLRLIAAGLRAVIEQAELEQEKLIELRRQLQIAIAQRIGVPRLKPEPSSFAVPKTSKTPALFSAFGGKSSAEPVAGPIPVTPLPNGRCLAVVAGQVVKLPPRPAALFRYLILDAPLLEAGNAQPFSDGIVPWKSLEAVRVNLRIPPKEMVTAHSIEVLVDRLQDCLARAGLDRRLVQQDPKRGLRFAVRSKSAAGGGMENSM